MENWPEWLRTLAAGSSMTVFGAAVGRLLWHIGMVRRGERRFWSVELIWESLIAVGMGLAAGGAAEYLGLGGKPALALAAVLGYLGPRGLEAIFRAWITVSKK